MSTSGPSIDILRTSASGHAVVELTMKQVSTLPWHITPKGTLYGPIYGIYLG